MKDRIFKTKLARENWASKYRYDNETPLETQFRAAKALASVEKTEFQDYWFHQFLDTLVRFTSASGEKVAIGLKATLGGRITANIGTAYNGATLMNCFSGDEKFITREHGIVSFREVVGQTVTVLTRYGWREAEVNCFGVQPIQRVTFVPAYKQEPIFDNQTKPLYRAMKGKYAVSVKVTPDHRWILADGSDTTELSVGDVVLSATAEVDKTSADYVNGFRHGFVFGDGNYSRTYANGDTKFELRLFGQKDMAYAHMFEKVKEAEWVKDGAVTYLRSPENLKDLPDNKKSANYTAGFIDGWAAADGSILDESRVEICSTNRKALAWLKENAPYAGYVVTGFRKDKGMETNLGKRNKQLARIIMTKKPVFFKVESIETFIEEEEVFCATVPGVAEFTLASGVYTSNCYINGPVSGAAIKYVRSIPGTEKVIDIEIKTDSSPDDLSNIFLTMLEQAQTLKSEGGWGLDFSWIRPRADVIASLGIRHPGIVKYMELFDKVSEVIVMGDNDGYKDLLKNYLDLEPKSEVGKKLTKKLKKMARKGAMMGSLRVDHPDIEEFVRAKQTSGRLTKFNISVMVTNEFMEAVEKDELFDLRFNGRVYKRVMARDLYELIMQSTYNRAEPGILFYDNMQANNPLAYLGELNCTNPCGEIGGNPFISTVCLLGSLNLTQYVNDDRTFDWDLYKRDVRVFARMLDNVNDLTYTPLPQYNWAVKNVRQYGMGINGLGSALYMMGIAYNSPEAIEFTDQVNWWKEELCWETSAKLAAEKGAFPAYNEKFLETNWFCHYTRISEETKNLIRKYGARNGKTTTNPPLGNTSVVCDMVSNGIEPVFMHEYYRTYIADGWPDGMTIENVKSILKETKQGDAIVWQGEFNGVKYHYEPHNRGLCITEPVRDYGYQWVMDNHPEDIDNSASYLVTTNDLGIDDHVAVQVVTQRNINQSVSKTANLPNDYPFDDFKRLYMDAWKKGLNGFTTYRDGSMEAVLTKVEKKEIEEEAPQIIRSGLKLPEEFVNGPTKIFNREGSKWYINLSYLPEDKDLKYPVAMWIHTNHKGEMVAANAAVRALTKLLRSFEINDELIERQLEKIKGSPEHDRVAKMVSMCLRHNLPVTSIVLALEGLDGDYISSLLTTVRKFLSGKIADGTKIVGKYCLSCNSPNIVFQSGCATCQDCGFSGCG